MDEISVLINTIHGYFRWRRGSHDAIPFLAWEKDNARKKGQLTFAEYLSFRFFFAQVAVSVCALFKHGSRQKQRSFTTFLWVFFDPEFRSYVASYYRHNTACLQIRGSAVVFPVSEEKNDKDAQKALCSTVRRGRGVKVRRGRCSTYVSLSHESS